jgi:hypothetical protein
MDTSTVLLRSFCGPSIAIICLWCNCESEEPGTGSTGWIWDVKLKEVNICRYGSGSSTSTGRWDGIGFSGALSIAGDGTVTAVKGRNEHRRFNTGGLRAFSSARSAPLSLLMKLLSSYELDISVRIRA